ncbi:hypothetical protein Dsin_013050 [Dipteronia sinensis]|uniref:Uncharacterized protein n=1 Tax=Dipteronia sinensis TaxID=43782 RepID=A0AAE0AK10_9ROSI|nr:hypothetical protein Dsin_013050 [Dipteronia sinensis]
MEEEINEHIGSSYKNNFNYSPSSSPPTPPSPLPISVGPGNHNYSFSPSVSPSPPFSPPSSAHPSAENLPLLLPHDKLPPSAFSLDGKLTVAQETDDLDKTASCLKDLSLIKDPSRFMKINNAQHCRVRVSATYICPIEAFL